MDKQEIERWENGCPKIEINEKDRKKGESWMDRQTDDLPGVSPRHTAGQ